MTITLSKTRAYFSILCSIMAAGLMATGCATDSPSPTYPAADASATNGSPASAETTRPEVFQVGDAITVVFSDINPPPAPMDEKVKEDGTVTLLYNKAFVAVGKSRGDLEKEIRAAYVPSYYNNLTVTIHTLGRFFWVGGEVKNPSRQDYVGPVTVLKAIQSCGDFTDFANRKKVRLTHSDGHSQFINCIKAIEDPRLDVEVLPGDKIHVPRRIL